MIEASNNQISFQPATHQHPLISGGFVYPSVKLLLSHSLSSIGTSSLFLTAARASMQSAGLSLSKAVEEVVDGARL